MKLQNPILPLTILLALFSTYLLAEKTDPPKFHRSSDFGWTANQDITLEFNQLLEDGKLGVGSELLLEHR